MAKGKKEGKKTTGEERRESLSFLFLSSDGSLFSLQYGFIQQLTQGRLPSSDF